MAKQSGPQFITGTVNGICFYRMNGQYYARRKSSLSRKRVKRDPAFTLTRVYADLMGRASRMAAEVYRTLPKDQKKHALYRALTGKALLWLKQGVDEAEIREQLGREIVKPKEIAPRQQPAVVLSAGNVVRMVWQHGGKMVVECKAAEEVKQRNGRALTWKVIRGDREYEVRIEETKNRRLADAAAFL